VLHRAARWCRPFTQLPLPSPRARAGGSGGADLTPYYAYGEDVILSLSSRLKAACTRHPEPVNYPRFKKGCDDLFLPCRTAASTAASAGFLYYLEGTHGASFPFVQDCGSAFLDAYLPIARRRMAEPYTEAERHFQEFAGAAMSSST